MIRRGMDAGLRAVADLRHRRIAQARQRFAVGHGTSAEVKDRDGEHHEQRHDQRHASFVGTARYRSFRAKRFVLPLRGAARATDGGSGCTRFM